MEKWPIPPNPSTVRIKRYLPRRIRRHSSVAMLGGRKWLAFPLPTKTDRSGQFTAYVEFGQPGRYRLRLLDPDTGVMSKPLVLDVKG